LPLAHEPLGCNAKKRMTARVYSCQFASPVVLFALQHFELAGEAKWQTINWKFEASFSKISQWE
jgi:hypothetical protein